LAEISSLPSRSTLPLEFRVQMIVRNQGRTSEALGTRGRGPLAGDRIAPGERLLVFFRGPNTPQRRSGDRRAETGGGSSGRCVNGPRRHLGEEERANHVSRSPRPGDGGTPPYCSSHAGWGPTEAIHGGGCSGTGELGSLPHEGLKVPGAELQGARLSRRNPPGEISRWGAEV